MEQSTPIPLRRIPAATNFVARSNDPSRAYRPPSGGAGFRVEQGGTPYLRMVNAAQFPIGSKPPVPALTARRLGKISICYATTLCYATHSRSLIVHAENTLGTSAISDHASRMSQVIPTPGSLRGASSCGCNKLTSRPRPGLEGAKHRDGSHLASTLLASLREQTTPIGPPPW